MLSLKPCARRHAQTGGRPPGHEPTKLDQKINLLAVWQAGATPQSRGAAALVSGAGRPSGARWRNSEPAPGRCLGARRHNQSSPEPQSRSPAGCLEAQLQRTGTEGAGGGGTWVAALPAGPWALLHEEDQQAAGAEGASTPRRRPLSPSGAQTASKGAGDTGGGTRKPAGPAASNRPPGVRALTPCGACVARPDKVGVVVLQRRKVEHAALGGVVVRVPSGGYKNACGACGAGGAARAARSAAKRSRSLAAAPAALPASTESAWAARTAAAALPGASMPGRQPLPAQLHAPAHRPRHRTCAHTRWGGGTTALPG